MGKPVPSDAREKAEFEAGGGGGDSDNLGIELEGPGERAEISHWSARDLPPRCPVLSGGERGCSQLGSLGFGVWRNG